MSVHTGAYTYQQNNVYIKTAMSVEDAHSKAGRWEQGARYITKSNGKEERTEHEASLKRQAWWYRPVILAAWETEEGRSWDRCLPGQQAEFKDSLGKLKMLCFKIKCEKKERRKKNTLFIDSYVWSNKMSL